MNRKRRYQDNSTGATTVGIMTLGLTTFIKEHTQHKDPEHNCKLCSTKHNKSALMMRFVMLRVSVFSFVKLSVLC